jgi:flagellar basal body-associated protein FliL
MAKHIHITLSEKAEKELAELQTMLDAGSIADVIRSSLAMRRFIELEKQQGNELVIKDKKNKIDKQLVSFQ